ncbi:hypothetical protein IC614_01155 [Allosphingosinicella flava]|uniref:Lipoprotein n=1 Tax=Allosphingosinicella flava TaxID=2771430 RepID=A0A7T2LM79_9SPHN|nr:hypothetical protein [Sphingosinicella flava]QPQ55256.1 hypothetical protein IC614_01155 [Sphingosinicella flava]
MKRAFTVMTCAAALAACSADISEKSRMRLPKTPEAEMEQLDITGIGFGQRGSFRIFNPATGSDEAGGNYVRSAGRAELFDFGGNVGRVEFTLNGDRIDGRLAAFCEYDEADTALSEAIEMTIKPFSYRCKMERDGFPIDAGLEIHARGIGGNERRGEIVFEGERLELRSVHKMKGGGLPSGTPVGYVFMKDGREIGGVDTNGIRTNRIYLPRDPGLQEAAMMASLALAIVWDPQDTLED